MTPEFQVRLLGDIAVHQDGRRLPLTAGRLRTLFVLLVVLRGATAAPDVLTKQLWDDEPPPRSRSTLQVYVMRLRRVLGRSPVIVHRNLGYGVDPALLDVDLWRFQDLLAAARRARAASDTAGETTALDGALALWSGPPLGAACPVSLARGLVPRLVEEHAAAARRRDELVRGVEAAGPALDDPAGSAHPGSASDAGRASPEGPRGPLPPPDVVVAALRSSFQYLLTAKPPWSAPAQLPPDLVGFLGRDGEVDRAERLLRRAGADEGMPQLIVSGPPGIGKTSLAVHVGHRCRDAFPDGQLYVNLRGYSRDAPLPPTTALSWFLRALGAPAAEIVDLALEEQTGLYRTLLADRRMLILLDNAAHAEQIAPLLPGGGACAVVVTSRDDLRAAQLGGAVPIALGAFDPDESRMLLVRALGAAAAAEPTAIDQLVDACAGLPLALQMVAAQLHTNGHLPLAPVTTRLSRGWLDQFRADSGPSALREVFDQSYTRLPPESARLFRLLSLVPGSRYGADEAAALLDAPVPAAERLLDRLAAVNLVVACGDRQFRFHDLLQEFAAAKVGEREEAVAAERLREFYLRSAYAMDEFLYPGMPRLLRSAAETGFAVLPTDESSALEWLDAERPKLLAVASRAASTQRGRYVCLFADALRGYLSARGPAADGWALCESALEAARSCGDALAEASALDLAGRLYFNASRFLKAHDAHMGALRLFRGLDDQRGQASTLNSLSRIAIQLGPVESSVRHDEEAMTIVQRLGDVEGKMATLVGLGVSHLSAGQIIQAITAYQRALDLTEGVRNHAVVSRALIGTGMALWNKGDIAEAWIAYRRAGDLAHRIGDRHLEASSHGCAAELLCDSGQFDQAIEEAQMAIELGRVTGERRHEVSGREIIVTARMAMGDVAGVVDEYCSVVAAARHIRYSYGEISSLIGLSRARRTVSGAAVRALIDAEEAQRRAGETGTGVLTARALIEVGLSRLALGEPVQAEADLRAAVRLTRRNGQGHVTVRALAGLDAVLRASGERPGALVESTTRHERTSPSRTVADISLTSRAIRSSSFSRNGELLR